MVWVIGCRDGAGRVKGCRWCRAEKYCNSNRHGQRGYEEEPHAPEAEGAENEVKWWGFRFIRLDTWLNRSEAVVWSVLEATWNRQRWRWSNKAT